MPRWLQIEVRFARHSSLQFIPFRRAFSCSRAARGRYRIDALLNHASPIEAVEVNGWIRSLRRQKRVAFLALGDGSSLESLQAVLSPEQSEGLSHGAAVSLKGAWVASSGKSQSNELQVASVESLGDNDAEHNPIQPKYQTPEYLRTIPHLRGQVPFNALLLQFRSKLIAAVTQWFSEHDFVQCHTPIITSSDCEGAGEVFTVESNEGVADISPSAKPKFFKTAKYLTVSAQLHLEALSQAVDKVWTLSPTFRAEQSDTPRHLSEFYMLEAELSFTESMNEVMDVVENMLRGITISLQQTKVAEQLIRRKRHTGDDELMEDALQARWDGLVRSAWQRISYADAIEHLLKAHSSGTQPFIITPSVDDGLAAEHERFIATSIGRGSPVFVTDYPQIQKPFYMARSSNDNAACFDLLVPDLCELAGGSLREHRLGEIEATMTSKGVSGLGLEWYKDLRRYGSVPHGGFGIGFDRLLCYLTGISTVRDVVSFPRYHGKCDC